MPHSPADAPAQKLNEDRMDAPTRCNAGPVVACLLAPSAAAGARAADDPAIVGFFVGTAGRTASGLEVRHAAEQVTDEVHRR